MIFVARIKEFKAAETKGVQVSMAIKNWVHFVMWPNNLILLAMTCIRI